jgi:hypothetical protein
MHHEDRAGVNAFIHGVDRLADPDRPVTFDRAVQIVSAMKATPPFRDGK